VADLRVSDDVFVDNDAVVHMTDSVAWSVVGAIGALGMQKVNTKTP
jgi:hypothetical protein